MSVISLESLPFENYLAREGVSKSKLAAFAKAPALAHVAVEETAAMRMGTLVHTAILEPRELDLRYAVTDVDRRGTKAWEAAEIAAHGKILVKRGDYDDALRMRDAVWANPTARELLDGCQTEQSVFWSDEDTGLYCKARADAINPALRILVDVKTTTDASQKKFAKQFIDMKYGWQDAHYFNGFSACGFPPEAFVFLSIEKEPPHLIACYELSAADRQSMQFQLAETMHKYAQCLRENNWPGYEPKIQTIKLPEWVWSE